MNLLKNRLVYLCGAIGKAEDDGQGWRDEVTPRLLEMEIQVSDPTKETVGGMGEVGEDKRQWDALRKEGKLDELKEKFWPIVHKDLRCVDRADFLIFRYIPGVPTVGTIHELVVAQGQKKPILMVIKPEEIGELNPWILTFIKKGCMFTSFEEMYIYLNKVSNGEFNTSYWSL